MRWRVGRSSSVSGGDIDPNDQCCGWLSGSGHNGVWHAAWSRQRCCMGLDITGSAGATVYAAGSNESPSAVKVWARRASRCEVHVFAGATPPSSPNASSAVLRLVHLDLDGSGRNPRNLTGAWKTIVSVPAYTAFAILVGYLSAVSGGSDVCGYTTTGPHLHMDAPTSATRNTSLRDGQSLSPTSWAYIF